MKTFKEKIEYAYETLLEYKQEKYYSYTIALDDLSDFKLRFIVMSDDKEKDKINYGVELYYTFDYESNTIAVFSRSVNDKDFTLVEFKSVVKKALQYGINDFIDIIAGLKKHIVKV